MCIHDIRNYYSLNPNQELDFLCSTPYCKERNVFLSAVNAKKPDNLCKKTPHLKGRPNDEHPLYCPFHKNYNGQPKEEREIDNETSNRQTNFKQDDIIDVFDPDEPVGNVKTELSENSSNNSSDTVRASSQRHRQVNPEHHNKNHSRDFIRLVNDFLKLDDVEKKTRTLRVKKLGEITWQDYFVPLHTKFSENARVPPVRFWNIRTVKSLDYGFLIEFWHKTGSHSNSLFISYSLFENQSRHHRIKEYLTSLQTKDSCSHLICYFLTNEVKISIKQNRKGIQREHYLYHLKMLSNLFVI